MDVTCSCKLFPPAHQVLPGKAWGWGRERQPTRRWGGCAKDALCSAQICRACRDHEAVEPASHPQAEEDHLETKAHSQHHWQQRTAVNNEACGALEWRTETKQPDCQLDFHGLHLNSLLISGHRYYSRRWWRLVVENPPTNAGDERPGFNP